MWTLNIDNWESGHLGRLPRSRQLPHETSARQARPGRPQGGLRGGSFIATGGWNIYHFNIERPEMGEFYWRWKIHHFTTKVPEGREVFNQHESPIFSEVSWLTEIDISSKCVQRERILLSSIMGCSKKRTQTPVRKPCKEKDEAENNFSVTNYHFNVKEQKQCVLCRGLIMQGHLLSAAGHNTWVLVLLLRSLFIRRIAFVITTILGKMDIAAFVRLFSRNDPSPNEKGWFSLAMILVQTNKPFFVWYYLCIKMGCDCYSFFLFFVSWCTIAESARNDSIIWAIDAKLLKYLPHFW